MECNPNDHINACYGDMKVTQSILFHSRHEKRRGRAATGRGNVDGLQKCYACSTEFFSYTLLKVEILWNFHKYYTNCPFKYTFKPFKRCLKWQTTQNCGYIKNLTCVNFRFTRKVSAEGFKLFSCLSDYSLQKDWLGEYIGIGIG